MTCYRENCKRKSECDYLVAATCLDRVTKKQKKVKLQVNKNLCKHCLNEMVRARYKKKSIMLCTTCNNVLEQLREKGA